ncbi:GDSL esterase/lipase [Striga hermonthica]|uniref:GDSL esterase/lipase n=1 Tax=Striga hermonthica TaxID=68872 RepID=A0A9N7RBL8_STRHE|nr:GDSL esterase/lipase [Striga hermonthica]
MAKAKKTLALTISLISLAITTWGRRLIIPESPPCDFPAIYNFGDSNSDTGAISAAFWPTPPPYGLSYFGKPAGRNSDGRLIIDFIAEHLGLPYLSPYLDSIGMNFKHGANFATAGSTIRMQNETIFENGLSPFSLDVQTVQHYQFKIRTSELYNQGDDPIRAQNPADKNKLPIPQEFSKALYTFDIGQNDISSGFRKLTVPQLRDSIPDIINRFSASVTLKDRIGSLRAELPHAAITYVNIYSAKYRLIKNASLYGFNDPFKICCGHHENNVHVWCGQRVTINGTDLIGDSCGSPESCISWDGVHYSQAANQWIANQILNGSFSEPPIPISRACLKH